jgi:phosphoribosylanthranilate isomerase
MVNIKICGMTNMDDCRAAYDLGVDFIGFVFYRKSRRYISPENVREIVDALEGGVKTVGVFVDESEREVKEIVDFCDLDFAQVYRPMAIDGKISVFRVQDSSPEVESEGLVLFDSFTDAFGGSGIPFEYELLRGHSALPRAFIAGGIDENNVSRVLALNPYGIDLVSSVEICPGAKDRKKMKNLVNKVRSFAL